MSKPERRGYPEGTRVRITGSSLQTFAEDPADLFGKEGTVQINSYPRNDPGAWFSWVAVDEVMRELPGYSIPFVGWFPKESLEEVELEEGKGQA